MTARTGILLCEDNNRWDIDKIRCFETRSVQKSPGKQAEYSETNPYLYTHRYTKYLQNTVDYTVILLITLFAALTMTLKNIYSIAFTI